MRYRSAPSVVNLNGEVAKLTLFQRTPYRKGLLLAIKASGKDIGNAISPATSSFTFSTEPRKIVCDDGPPKSCLFRAGTIAAMAQAA
jgi:hypothetical protein